MTDAQKLEAIRKICKRKLRLPPVGVLDEERNGDGELPEEFARAWRHGGDTIATKVRAILDGAT